MSGMAFLPTEKWMRRNYLILEVNLCNICFQIKPWQKNTQPTGHCGEEVGSGIASSAKAPIKFKPVGRFLQLSEVTVAATLHIVVRTAFLTK